jgi:hypothetical protein
VLELFEISDDTANFRVAMGSIFGGYCIVGPAENVVHSEAVFQVLLAAFRSLREGYDAEPDTYDPLIYVLTPSNGADDWDLVRLSVKDGFDFYPAQWSPDIAAALTEAKELFAAG